MLLAWWKTVQEERAAQYDNNLLAALKAVFQLQIESGVIASNPLKDFKRMKIPVYEPNLPSMEDFRKLVLSIRSQKKRASEESADFVEWLAYSGMQVADVAELTWVDVKDDVIVVKRSSNKDAQGNKTTKNSMMRRVPIIGELAKLVSRRREQNGEGPIFSIKTPSRALTSVCKRLELDHIKVHDLRHLFATVCIESGVDIPTVARWMGHQDGGVLAMKTYGHLRDEHSIASARKVDFG